MKMWSMLTFNIFVTNMTEFFLPFVCSRKEMKKRKLKNKGHIRVASNRSLSHVNE